ncbi:hypothetical protein E4M02_04370 [Brevundimonas sp. S30B]|uniref:hypothetical protein n=1 Tax=unclassified Brevundimonas TaxID=2622653 RepID=UPI0010729AF6|nr:MULTISPECIES: hypothetical protein [unclassified Brevundimonas]QBX36894.1 hypothetical protein E4M01_03445 [Brevundimonas sp. MF30-B]TFW04311.1 hypothetical protein E4M02_04370 [Brevundimonas sp. S30B]
MRIASFIIGCAVALAGCSQSGTKAPESSAFILQCDGHVREAGRGGPTPQRRTYRIDPDAKTFAHWNPDTRRFVTFAELNEAGEETMDVSPASIVIRSRPARTEDSVQNSVTRFDRTLGTVSVRTDLLIPEAHIQVSFDAPCVKVDQPASQAF